MQRRMSGLHGQLLQLYDDISPEGETVSRRKVRADGNGERNSAAWKVRSRTFGTAPKIYP